MRVVPGGSSRYQPLNSRRPEWRRLRRTLHTMRAIRIWILLRGKNYQRGSWIRHLARDRVGVRPTRELFDRAPNTEGVSCTQVIAPKSV